MNCKYFILLFLILFAVNVSAQPSQQFVSELDGLNLEAPYSLYHPKNLNKSIQVYIYNGTSGKLLRPDEDVVSCYYNSYDHSTGGFPLIASGILEGYGAGYNTTMSGSLLDENGDYSILIWCNSSLQGGYFEYTFTVNKYGQSLTEATSGTFNFGMGFIVIFFIISLVGIFSFNNLNAKLACYWTAHVLFVVGIFSLWQFNEGYSIAFTGLAGIFKVLFYFSIIAVFPMLILSLALIF